MAYHEDKLPKFAASRLLTDGSPILIKRGESGYYPQDADFDPTAFNNQRSITPAQVAAMENGSMFGWEIPAADPDNEHNASLTEFTYEDRG